MTVEPSRSAPQRAALPGRSEAQIGAKLAEAARTHIDRLLQTRRAVLFVWRAAPGWTIANGIVILLRSVLPVTLLLLLKLLVDALAHPGAQAAGTAFAPGGSALFIMVLMAAIALVQSLTSALAQIASEMQTQAVADYMNGILHKKSVEVDLAYYELPRYQDTLHRAQEQAPHRPRRIVERLVDLAQNTVLLIAMCGILIAYHWSILPILGLVSLPGILLRMRSASRYYDAERRATADERRAAYYNEILRSAQYATDIRLLDLGALFQERFATLRLALRRHRMRLVWRRSFGMILVEVCAILGMSAVFVLMIRSVAAGAISIGGLFMYFTAMQRAWAHAGAMMRSTSDLYEDNLFLKEFYEFLDLEPEIADPAAPRAFPAPIRAGIALDRISFRYPSGTRPALEDVSLVIRPGEHIALVGENGSGKTTLVKLLCRLYDVDAGAITIDGTDIRDFRLRDLRRAIGLLVQDYTRYALTARENIRLGDVALGGGDPRIVGAAKEAGADGIIRSLACGYDTVLGNRFRNGEELSVGQWQRVALARIYVRDAPILILDEPTSALDPQAEEDVLAGFAAAAKGHTTITISHRLSAVRNVDRIYVMEKGRIVEQGTHSELMRGDRIYARLFRMQARRYADAGA